MNQRQSIHNKIYYRLFLLLSFLLPVYDRLVVTVIILIVLNWLAEGRYLTKFKAIFKEKHRLLLFSFSAFYVIYGIGLIYSNNFPEGIFGLEVKLSLLIFPVIFATIDKNILDNRKILHLFFAFIAGCFLVSLGLLINAFINYRQSFSIYEFYYTSLAAYRHTSYLSMYLNLAFSMIILFMINYGGLLKLHQKLILGIICGIFYTFIILLSSKAGIVCLAVILLLFVIYFIVKQRRYLKGVALACIIVLSFILAFSIFPTPLDRFHEAEKTLKRIDQLEIGDTESTAERIVIWRAASDLVMENFIAGVGIGDVRESLCFTYKKKQIWQAYRLQLNAHNQYLQTFLASGVIGFIVLVLCLLVPACLSIRNNHFIYFIFLIIIGFNFLFESMLCRQEGVVFYAYFNALLWFIYPTVSFIKS